MKSCLFFAVVLLCITNTIRTSQGQGAVTFVNTTFTPVQTNASATGGGIGRIALPSIAPGEYIFALLTAPSTVTSVSLSLQELLTPTWSFTGLYATNGNLVGRFNGGSFAIASNWAPGIEQSYIVVGWSAELAGQNWNVVANDLSGATFNGSFWNMPNYLDNLGFFGASAVGTGIAGGTAENGDIFPAFGLFGSSSSGQGTPITTGFTIYLTAPEPGVLSVLALCALLVGRPRLHRLISPSVCED